MAQSQQETMKKNGNGVAEEEITPELEARLPFPNATVVRVMREVIDKDKIISKRAKIEMNKWLAEVCKDVAKELNKTPYAKIEGDDFSNAVKKYKQFEDLHREKEKIKRGLERVTQDANALISDLERTVKE